MIISHLIVLMPLYKMLGGYEPTVGVELLLHAVSSFFGQSTLTSNGFCFFSVSSDISCCAQSSTTGNKTVSVTDPIPE